MNVKQQARFRSAAQRRPRSGDQRDMLFLFLSDGPRTLAELEQRYIEIPHRFGVFIELYDREAIERGDLSALLRESLQEMIAAGSVTLQGDRYALTELGQQNASLRRSGFSRAAHGLEKMLHPQMVPQVSMRVHFLLALIKLPAGYFSGSIGLVNDGVDTLLDGLSSGLVYLGMRFERERLVNVFLVLLMLGTGVFALYEAVQRFLAPHEPRADWFAFLAAIISALVCLALGAYQRYVGARSGSLALITQSVDSRNHVITAVGVTVGLLAALLHFSLLDTLVGLAVALMILKSGIELAVETVRWMNSGESEYTAEQPALLKRYDRFRQEQLCDWMLYLLDQEDCLTPEDLRRRARQALDFSRNPALRPFGLSEQPQAEAKIEHGVQELHERGWVEGGESWRITTAGRKALARLSKRQRRPRR